MLIETGVLHCYHRLLQEEGDALQRSPVALLRQQADDEAPAVVEDLDLAVIRRQQCIGDKIVRGPRHRNDEQSNEQEQEGGGKNFSVQRDKSGEQNAGDSFSAWATAAGD
jgi:hypothetical protein